jgi:hypothetical protein
VELAEVPRRKNTDEQRTHAERENVRHGSRIEDTNASH